MSDRKFLRTFRGLIGGLVALTVVLLILAQIIGEATTPEPSAVADAKAVAERIKPVGEVTVSTNRIMNSLISAANAGGDDQGKAVYDKACAACHAAGVAGAPKFGDAAAWKGRIAKGTDALYQNALKGFQGKAGFMPAKGGRADLSDAEVKSAVDYMVSKAK